MNAFTSRIASLIPVLLIVTSLTTMVAAVASNDLLFAAAIDHASLLEAGKEGPVTLDPPPTDTYAEDTMNPLTVRVTTLVPVLLIVASLTAMVAAVASNDILTAAAVDHTLLIEAGHKAP